MDGLIYISVVLALLVCGAGWRCVHQLKRKRILSGGLWAAQGGGLLILFILVLLVYSNLLSYRYLRYEAPIADVYLRQLEPRKYQLSLSSSEQDEDQHYFVLEGEQWQLDAKILKWTGWTNLLGLGSYYQLHRVSASYTDVAEGRLRLASVFDLSSDQVRGLDVWRLKAILKSSPGFVDARYGRGKLMPMRDGAHFRVSIGQHGMQVQAVNEVARFALLQRTDSAH